VSAAYVRRYYGVPARRGARVEFDGQPGVITSCPGAYVRVRLDGQRCSVPAHPTRLMSVSFTEQAVRDRTKTVTRRKGWRFLRPGERITLCRKVMGRKFGEPLVRIVDVEVVDVRRERLADITDDDVAREGFPDMSREEFIRRFFVEAQGIRPDDTVTRIEWVYCE
jgi:hypothetical protein